MNKALSEQMFLVEKGRVGVFPALKKFLLNTSRRYLRVKSRSEEAVTVESAKKHAEEPDACLCVQCTSIVSFVLISLHLFFPFHAHIWLELVISS